MSKVDWSKAPEGAEFYAAELFYKRNASGFLIYYENDWWHDSMFSLQNRKERPDYQPRPVEWPTETRIDNIGRNRTEDDMGHYDNEREQHEAKHDPVNNPKHYAIAPGVEAIDIIKASLTPEQFKGYLLGNFLKYRLRAGDKGDLQQDIDKSNWYRERLNAL